MEIHGLNRAFFKGLHESMQKETMSSTKGEQFSIESSKERSKSFVGFDLVLSDKTARTLKRVNTLHILCMFLIKVSLSC